MNDLILEHLGKLVSCYPVSNNQTAVSELLEYCLLNIKQTTFFPDAKIHNINGVHSLYASTCASKTPRVLLQAHIDVVPAAKNIRKLFKSSDNRVVGRGVYDMLYGTACYLTLIEDLADKLSKHNIGILLTGDEELGGFNGTGHFVSEGYGADVVVLPDAGDGLGQMNTGSKGIYSFDLLVNGKAHHASRPWEGDGAGNKMIMALNEVIQLSVNSPQSPFTVTVTILSGGEAMNKAPSNANAHVDVRYVNNVELTKFKRSLKTILKKYNGQVTNLLEAPSFDLDTNNSFVRQFIDIYSKIIKQEVELTRTDGSSDARFFAKKNIPVIMLRPKGGEAHGDNEWLDTSELDDFYKILKEFIIKVA